MIHVSLPPDEVGVFDAVEANAVAIDIVNGAFLREQMDYSGRFVTLEEHHEEIEDRIELLTIEDFIEPLERQTLRTRAYAQVFSEIEKRRFPGYPWHVDVEDIADPVPKYIDFNFGSSTHPTKYFVGEVDLHDAADYVRNMYRDYFDKKSPLTLPLILKMGGCLVQAAIDDSVASGMGQIVHAHPGVLYKMQKGSVHRMQEFDSDRIHIPRFCIEKYLIAK